HFGGSWEIQFGGAPSLFGAIFPLVYTLKPLTGINCPAAGTCFAVGQSGVITTTTTGGDVWSRVHPGGSTTVVAGMSCPDSTNCFAVGGNKILVTHDGGTTWPVQSLTTTDLLTAITCPSSTTCFAAGWPGAIYYTGDGGAHLSYQSSPLSGTAHTFDAISCPTVTACVVVGVLGIAMATSDGGASWQTENSGTTKIIEGIVCSSASTCVAVGSGGLALTRNG